VPIRDRRTYFLSYRQLLPGVTDGRSRLAVVAAELTAVGSADAAASTRCQACGRCTHENVVIREERYPGEEDSRHERTRLHDKRAKRTCR